MDTMQVDQVARIAPRRSIPTIEDLRAWDWRDELRRQERSMGWLGRHTEKSAGALSRYSSGDLPTPDSWLIAAARALGVELGFEVAA